MASADRAVAYALMQDDIERQEEKERKQVVKDLKQLVYDKETLTKAGIDPTGLSPQEVRDTAKAMRLSASEEVSRRDSEKQGDPDTEMTDAPKGKQKQESRKGSKQKGSEKDAKGKKVQRDEEDEGSEDSDEDVTDAEWLEASNYQPEKLPDCEDFYDKEVWDI